MKGRTDAPRFTVAILRPMETKTPETLEEYMARRAIVRAELTGDDGDNDPLVQYALGNHPKQPPLKLNCFEPGWVFKRQAE